MAQRCFCRFRLRTFDVKDARHSNQVNVDEVITKVE